jgi:hypothetical protein
MAQKEKPSIGRAVVGGLIAGLIAAVFMAIYAMVAGATYLGSGFFTPMYHIASALIEPTAMETSMEQAMEGGLFYFAPGPAGLGLLIHMAVGAIFGGIFGLILWTLRLRGGIAVASGVLYGLLVLAAMSFVGLPIVADVFGGGEPIEQMPAMVGWPTFTIEHALFGLVLGLWPLLRPGDVAVEISATRTELRRTA